MSTTYTTNYHLGKQEDTSDNFNMSVITENMDIIDTALSGKQATLTTTQLSAVNSGIDSTKVAQIETNKNNISSKANTSDVNTATANLQAQINNIITPVTQDAEVENARVGADSTSYETLKERLDSENAKIYRDLTTIVVDANAIERGAYANGVKSNENKRLRTSSYFVVKKGDVIYFNSATLYFNVAIFNNPISSTSQNSIEESGWLTQNYKVKHDGYMIVLFSNAATYGASTNIYVSDYDANTCIINDVFDTASLFDLKNTTYQCSKNLIPSNTTEIVPCYIPAGTKITMSTADGEVLNVSWLYLELYNNEKERSDIWNFTQSAKSRTITVKDDVYYIAWNIAVNRNLQVEIGDTKTAYAPYFRNAIGSVYDLYNASDNILKNNNKLLATNAIRKTASANYDTLSIIQMSDLHGQATRLKNVIDFYNGNKNKYTIKDILLTGDIVFQKYSNGMTWFDDVEGSEDILLAIGNHDATEGTTDYETSDHSQADLWSQYFNTRISNWNVENTSGNTYYYKDYADNGIRLIVINSMLSGDDMTAQTTWLETVLADALTENLAVVIGCHYRSNNLAKKSCNFTDYNKVLVNYSKNALPTTMLAAVQNFIDNNGEFVCYLCGHMHDDVICYNTDYPDQLFVAVVDAYGWENYDSDLDRVHTPDAFNLFFVDRTNHCFKLVRIGANCDTYLRTRNSIAIDYNSGLIISEN